MKLDYLLDILIPERCAHCLEPVEPGRRSPFCVRCQVSWEYEKSRHRASSYGRAAVSYAELGEPADPEKYASALHAVNYNPLKPDSIVSRLIFKLKHDATNRVVDFVASELAGMLEESASLLFDGRTRRDELIVTWIPRRPEAVIHDGYDHMERVAKALAKRLGITCSKLLIRSEGAREQKRLSATARLENASASLVLAKGSDLTGKVVILIDDLVTTGASMKSAAKLLGDSGARLIVAASLAASRRELSEN